VTGEQERQDRGSVALLLIGFVVMIMLLAYAVTAIGGVFLARQELQNLCDGAAAAAGDHVLPGVPGPQDASDARAAAEDYLSVHGGGVQIQVAAANGRAELVCSRDSAIPLGNFFTTDGEPLSVSLDVHADSTPVLHD
jgi:uncharacterized membrane protein